MRDQGIVGELEHSEEFKPHYLQTNDRKDKDDVAHHLDAFQQSSDILHSATLLLSVKDCGSHRIVSQLLVEVRADAQINS